MSNKDNNKNSISTPQMAFRLLKDLGKTFTKEDWIRCRKRTYFGIGLDAVLYDAQKGVRLSKQILFKIYIDSQMGHEEPLPKLINHWVMNQLKKLFNGEIEPTDLVSQSKELTKSNRNNRFNPFIKNSRINIPIIDYINKEVGTPKQELFKEMSKSGIKEMKDFPGEYTKPQFGDVGEDSLRKDMTTLKNRNVRLKRVEHLLGLYYQADTSEKEKIIKSKLKSHYKESAASQNLSSNLLMV